MKKLPLIPTKYKPLGWIILIPSLILGIFLIVTDLESSWLTLPVFAIIGSGILTETKYFSIIETDVILTITGVLIIVGGLLVAFSREKFEDEFISNMRLSSFQWAVFVNYAIMLLCFLFIYGPTFFTVMTFNMFTVLLLFIIRFNYLLFKNRQSMADEK